LTTEAWRTSREDRGQHAAEEPAVGDKTYWTFTLAVRLPGLGKVQPVLSFANAVLTGTAAISVTNRVDGSAQRIIALYG